MVLNLSKKRIIFILAMTLIMFSAISAISAYDSNTTTLGAAKDTTPVDDHSFTSLDKQIENADSTLKISGTYKYNSKTDSKLKSGVKITKDMKIIGKSKAVIDGKSIARCLRIDNKATVTLENLIIQNGYSKSNGAGIWVGSGSTLIIKNCVFKNNKVYNANGGAIYSQDNVKIKIASSKFINNKAIRHSNLKWDNFKKGMGSAIKTCLKNTVSIRDSTFKNNKAYLATVLVVSYSDNVKKPSKLNINHCRFVKSYSHHSGVVYLDEYGSGKILNSVFRKNYSPDGSGIIVLDTSKSAIVKNCKFSRNKGLDGGAICIKVLTEKKSSNVKITQCAFYKNVARHYGGAVYAVGGKVKTYKCKFTKNKAKWGGAIYTRLGSLRSTYAKFTKNIADKGGAIYLTCKKASFSKSKFTKNKAHSYKSIYTILKKVNCKKCIFDKIKVNSNLINSSIHQYP